ncbi:MAG: S-layer homology domain-containing protein [Clostridiaceae bacterium]|nr:S-layer homology domain-containing protein [Clostridiaceae bacterium]
MHISESGVVTVIPSRLEQKDGTWHITFEATEFSPYALVVRNSRSYDESEGVPYYLDEKGNMVFIGFAANGKYIAPEGVIVYTVQNKKDFTDISGHWAQSYIDFVTEREIFLGTSRNTFAPDEAMTRAMFVTVIGRLYERSYGEITPSANPTFNDCDYSAWYGKYVDWAAENNIIKGYGNGLFGPDDPVTREQMAVILHRFASFLGMLPIDMDDTLRYADADSIAGYAREAALYCQATGIIGGRPGGIFAPKDTATRADVATIIKRFIEVGLR